MLKPAVPGGAPAVSVGGMAPKTPMAPMIKSLAGAVGMITLPPTPCPELLAGVMSQGEAVLAPLTPNTTAAAQLGVVGLKVIVRSPTGPLEDLFAYHVSNRWPFVTILDLGTHEDIPGGVLILKTTLLEYWATER